MSERRVRFLVTLSIGLINLFFKIRGAKVDEIVGRAPASSPAAERDDDHDDQDHDEDSRTSRQPAREHEQEQEQLPADAAGPGGQAVECAELRREDVRSRLPRVDKFMLCYYAFTHLFNWYLLLKNLVLCVLRYESFARYRYLDCLLIGRFIINGRASEVVPHCACYAATMRLIWHFTMMRREPQFRLPCIEFLLGRASHEPFWAAAERAAEPASATPAAAHSTLLEYVSPSGGGCGGGGPEQGARAPKAPQGPPPPSASQPASSSCFKLRPNRTRTAWAHLARVTINHHIAFGLVFAFLVVFFYFMGLPITITQRGFELTYRHCLQWVADERRAGRLGVGASAGAAAAEASPQSSPMLSRLANRIYLAFDADNVSRKPPAVVREFFAPYANVVHLNAFQVWRLSHDFLDSFVLYWELAFAYNSSSFMAFIMSHDITYYSDSISARLERLIGRLRDAAAPSAERSVSALARIRKYDSLYLSADRRHQAWGSSLGLGLGLGLGAGLGLNPSRLSSSASNTAEPGAGSQAGPDARARTWALLPRQGEFVLAAAPSGASRTLAQTDTTASGPKRGPLCAQDAPSAAPCATDELRPEAADIQAQVADLFTLIDAYNRYISLQSMCLITAWLGYSALVSSWIFLPGNDNPKVEWYAAHVGATIYVFLMLSSMSRVKKSCRKLHKLISVAMALDEDYESGKPIWLSLLKFYSPRPLYCFTLLGGVEITYMLGIKLLVWLISALIVASSFFQVYNIK